MKKYIATFSGGKDSLDTVIWCMNNLQPHEWDIVFCDTDWEDELTYQHIRDIESKIGKQIITLKHKPFPITDEQRKAIVQIFGSNNIFAEMVVYKGRFPSTKARFCTEKLKSYPMIDHIISCNCDVVVLQGIRNDESQSRRNLKENDDYFKFYFEPYKTNKKGQKLYHSYRKKEVTAHCEKYAVDVLRPIIHKTAEQVFDSIYSNGFQPNPLYKLGLGRVGCFPCVMCQKNEIKQVAEINPLRIVQIRLLEKMC